MPKPPPLDLAVTLALLFTAKASTLLSQISSDIRRRAFDTMIVDKQFGLRFLRIKSVKEKQNIVVQQRSDRRHRPSLRVRHISGFFGLARFIADVTVTAWDFSHEKVVVVAVGTERTYSVHNVRMNSRCFIFWSMG